MKKALIILAISATFLVSMIPTSKPALANETVAQATTTASEAQLTAALKSFRAKVDAMQMSGDPDKDYMAMMKTLMAAMKNLSAAEMKEGKDSKTMSTAKKTFAAPSYGSFGV